MIRNVNVVCGTRLVLLVWLLAGAAGCAVQSPAVRFYLLTPFASETPSKEAARPPSGLRLGMGPIVLPDYLDRPQMVRRQGANQIFVSQNERWAEPLKTNFSRVLLENLNSLLETNEIYLFPWTHRKVTVDYRVEIDVYRFEGGPGRQVTLSARWMVSRGGDQRAVLHKQTAFQREATSAATGGVVAALNRLLTELSREIAAGIMRLEVESP